MRAEPDDLPVITVNYLSSGVLPRFLSSLPEASTRTLRPVVVDNASPDIAAVRELSREFDFDLIELPQNVGYGGGMNAGVAASGQSEYVLIANPDVVFQPGSIDLLLSAAQRADAGSLGPRILDPTGAIYPSARRAPSMRSGVGHALFAKIWRSNPWSREYHNHADSSEMRETDWLSGACLLLRRRAYVDVGGFDDSFFMYFEDVDLGVRLGKAGWANIYVPAAAVVHEGGYSTRQRTSTMEWAHHRSAYLYLRRRYPGAKFAPLRLALRSGLFLRAAWRARRVAAPKAE